jgi:hypothetical protein
VRISDEEHEKIKAPKIISALFLVLNASERWLKTKKTLTGDPGAFQQGLKIELLPWFCIF